MNGLASCGAGDDDPSLASDITTSGASRMTVSPPSTTVTTLQSATSTTTSVTDDGLDVIVPRDPDGHVPPDTPVTCDGTTTFPFSALVDPVPVAASGLPGVQAALDQALSEAGAPWPQDGWLVLSRSDEQVLVIYVDADTVGFMSFGSPGGGWDWEGSSLGDRCNLRTMLPAGFGEVDWRLDPAFPRPDADTTVLRLLATERDCASGEPMGDRLLGPQIVETDDSVLIAFAATPPPGDEQTCPENPPAPVTVELPAPLGDRKPRDGRLLTTDLTELIGTDPNAAPPGPPTTQNPLPVPTT